jgi:hypothetical protein
MQARANERVIPDLFSAVEERDGGRGHLMFVWPIPSRHILPG